jgi:DNA-binding winged helix-turn-helix (wHTH) protein
MWLRKKFEAFAKIPFRISTVPGAGYRVDLAPGTTVET